MTDTTIFCTTYKAGFKSPTVFTAKRHDLPIEVFGDDVPFGGFVSSKLVGLRKYLDGRTEEYCVFLDGNDMIVVANEDEIMRKYRELTRGKSTVLIGSERKLWPYPHLKKPLEELWGDSGSHSPFMYLDTGLIMGPVGELKDTLDVLIEKMEHYRKALPNVWVGPPSNMQIGWGDVRDYFMQDDVGLWSLALCDGFVDTTIDYNCEMICAVKNCDRTEVRIANGRLTLKDTRGRPCFVHCNGHRYVDRKKLKQYGLDLVGPDWEKR